MIIVLLTKVIFRLRLEKSLFMFIHVICLQVLHMYYDIIYQKFIPIKGRFVYKTYDKEQCNVS